MGRARRAGFVAGLAMVVAGLLMLGHVAWQFWGTNWRSHQRQQDVTHALEQRWERGGYHLQPRYVPRGQASALIRVPRFGKEYVVPVLEGTSPDVLAQGFGHFSDTANPGEPGNYALAAHRVTHGAPLRHLPDLRPGDVVVVETVSRTYTYRLDTDPDRLVVPFTATWVLDPLPRNPVAGGPQPVQRRGERLITMTTCSEIFHTDDRMVAFGHLVRVSRK